MFSFIFTITVIYIIEIVFEANVFYLYKFKAFLTVNTMVVSSIPIYRNELFSFPRFGDKIKRGVKLSHSKLRVQWPKKWAERGKRSLNFVYLNLAITKPNKLEKLT